MYCRTINITLRNFEICDQIWITYANLNNVVFLHNRNEKPSLYYNLSASNNDLVFGALGRQGEAWATVEIVEIRASNRSHHLSRQR